MAPRPRVIVLLAAVAAAALGVPGPAGAQAVQARSAALSSSASCAQGDIEITYAGSDLEAQRTRFSAADGRDLHHYDVATYAPAHDGLEYILSQTPSPPAAGTVVAVHVTIGPAMPDASSGEFFVVYRCDTVPNAEGGSNVVLDTCVGAYGTCPETAAEWQGEQNGTPIATPPKFTG